MSRIHATLPAARLRKGDLLPTYGECATVARPPVISPDGSMVTLLVATSAATDPSHTARLVRVPTDRDMEVARPAPAPDAKFVRRSRQAKSSGAQVLVLDLAHPESEIEPVGDHRYATLCVSHSSIRFHRGVSTAEAVSHHPEEWCTSCTEVTVTRARQRVYGTTHPAHPKQARP